MPEVKRLENLEALEVSLVPKAANKRKFLIFKAMGGEEMAKKKEDIKKKDEVIEDVKDDAKKEEKKEETKVEKKEEIKVESSEDLIEAINKMEDLPEGFKSVVQKMMDENKELKEKIEKAERERIRKEFVEKAKEFENLAVEPEEFGITLMEISEKAPKAYEEITKVLKAADNSLKNAGLFAEIGSEARDEGVMDAWSKIEKAAEEVSKKENITLAEAVKMVLEERPELYREYMDERGGN